MDVDENISASNKSQSVLHKITVDINLLINYIKFSTTRFNPKIHRKSLKSAVPLDLLSRHLENFN